MLSFSPLFYYFLCAYFVAANPDTGYEICSSGVKPGKSCNLVQSSGYECKSSNSSTSWCESFNGTYKCCEKLASKCKDKSSFCRLVKHLCASKSDFQTMKSKCEATCDFCNFNTFGEAERSKNRINELTGRQKCDLPHKCVFPKAMMLNITPDDVLNNVSTTTSINNSPTRTQSLLKNWSTSLNTFSSSPKPSSFSDNTTEEFETIQEVATAKLVNKTVAKIDLKTLLASAVQSKTTIQHVTSPKPRSIHARTTSIVNQNETRKQFSSRNRYETTSTITLPSSFNGSRTARRLTMEELKTARDTMPKIATAEPSSLVTSLSKTVIRGKCFDEYTYCREFTSLCSHPAFSEVMASHCSLTCDRCDEVERVEEGSENCEDMTPDCKNYRDLCDHSRYKTLMESYCPKVCGHCIPICRDRHQNCFQFLEDGFCTDTMYTSEERKYLCGATCSLC